VDVTARFTRLVALPEAEMDLGEGALLIAEAGDPLIDVERSGQALDEFSADVSDLTTLCRRLFVELGFEGDHTSYYEPENSFLNRVIERRRGIPISLAVLAIEVGRRAGVTLEGVGMPSHFVVREPSSGLYVDCYSARVLDERDLAALYRAAGLEAPADVGSVGALTAAGLVTFVVGSLMLYSPGPGIVAPQFGNPFDIGVSPAIIGVVAIGFVAFFGFVVRASLQARHRSPWELYPAAAGTMGMATTDLSPGGSVRVGGAEWTAASEDSPIQKGEKVIVVARNGIHLVVRRAGRPEGRGA